MKRRLTAIVMFSLMLAVIMVPALAFAKADSVQGDCSVNKDESVFYTITDEDDDDVLETLTIKGSGPMADYTQADLRPYNGYASNITTIIVDNGVTRIGNRAFRDMPEVTQITMADSVESIGIYAIANCGKIQSITIPANTTFLGASGATNIGSLGSCSSLIEINVAEGNNSFKSVDGVLFSKDGKVLYSYPAGKTQTEYEIPAGVETIEDNAFRGCVYLEKVTCPESLTSIKSYSFYEAVALKEVVLRSENFNISSGAVPETVKISSPWNSPDNWKAAAETNHPYIAGGGDNGARWWDLNHGVVQKSQITSVEFRNGFVPEDDSNVLDVWNAGYNGESYTDEVIAYVVREYDETICYLSYNNPEEDKVYVKDTAYSFFSGFTSMTEIVNLTNLDGRDAEMVNYFIYQCENLKELDLSNFNSSRIYNMGYFASGCKNIERIDMSGVRGVITLSVADLFDGCTNLKYVNISGLNTLQASKKRNWFRNCTHLEEVVVGEGITKDCLIMLPAQKSANITGADGKWHNKLGESYAAANIPVGSATWYAYPVPVSAGKITYDKNYGQAQNLVSVTADYDTDIILASALFKRNGFRLSSWNTEPDGTGTEYGLKQSVRFSAASEFCNNTLYAQWESFDDLYTIADIPDQEYTGLPVEPQITILKKGTEEESEERFDITYENNVNAGTAKAVLSTEDGLYKIASFNITSDEVSPSEEEPVLNSKWNWYKGDSGKNIFTAIEFSDSYIPDGTEDEFWAAGENGSSAVMCYVKGDKLIIAGNGTGKIYANEDSTAAFYHTFQKESTLTYFNNVTEFINIGIFDTSRVKNMAGMFVGMSKLESIDLSNFDTSQVTTVSFHGNDQQGGTFGIFENCGSLSQIIGLEKLDFGNIKENSLAYYAFLYDSIENLTDIPSNLLLNGGKDIGAGEFAGYTGLKKITVPETVETVGYDAFYQSNKAKWAVEEISIPAVKNIESYAFGANFARTLPASKFSFDTSALECISPYAFYNLKVLDDDTGEEVCVEIPSGTKVGTYSKYGAVPENTTMSLKLSDLKNITISSGNGAVAMQIPQGTTMISSNGNDTLELSFTGADAVVEADGNISVLGGGKAVIKKNGETATVTNNGDGTVTAADGVINAVIASPTGVKVPVNLTEGKVIIPAGSSVTSSTGAMEAPIGGSIILFGQEEQENIHLHTEGSPVKENYIEPTFTSTGSYDEVVYCDVCGYELSRESVTVPKKKRNNSSINNTDESTSTIGTVYSKDETASAAESGSGVNTGAEAAAKADSALDLTNTKGTAVSGKDFTEPAVLTIPVDTKNVDDVNNLTIAKFNPETGKLEIIGGSYDADEKAVKGYITEEGDYFAVEKDNLTTITLQIGVNKAVVNNQSRELDSAPVISQDRTMVPIRFIAEAFGAKVDWDGSTRTVTIEIDGKVLTMVIGQELEGFDAAPIISNDRTMVPIRYISEQFGANVIWVPSTYTVAVAK